MYSDNKIQKIQTPTNLKKQTTRTETKKEINTIRREYIYNAQRKLNTQLNKLQKEYIQTPEEEKIHSIQATSGQSIIRCMVFRTLK